MACHGALTCVLALAGLASFLRDAHCVHRGTGKQVSGGADTATNLNRRVARGLRAMLPSVTRRYMSPFPCLNGANIFPRWSAFARVTCSTAPSLFVVCYVTWRKKR